MVKFTVLGGSSVATPELVGAIIPYLRPGRDMLVMLHGRDAQKLELVGRVCQRMAEAAPGLTVAFTTDLTQALRAADIVLNQVRVGGLEARAYDETFPHRWGIPGEETVGPGGAANALRTIPVVLDQCRAIEALAPECTLLTFSNPSSVVQRAVTQHTGLKRVIGLCDVPYTMHHTAARALGVPAAALDTHYLGMHHFGWITSAQVNGQERLPHILANDSVCSALGLAPEVGRLTGTLPTPYFRYFFHPDRMLHRQQNAPQPRARELQQLERELLAVYAEHQGPHKPEAVSRRAARWYEAVVVPTLMTLTFGDPARLAVNIANSGLITDLPDDTIIEISASLEAGQIHALAPRRLPPPGMMALLQANAAYEHMLVEAIVTDSRDKLLAAFLVNPLVRSFDTAAALVAELWPRRGWSPPDQAGRERA